ncbi:Protein M3 [Tulasnella sp. 424]|nr:Protein M3 [Tulasnella sp. 424]KAG8972149.1 Protein M3 [Tulasnella sp. 425]
MLSVGSLIWISVKPLLKMALTTVFGILLTKNDLFGTVAARGTGQVILNITLPALLFSKVVPSFTSDNIRALGPLILIGSLYQLFGFLFAFLVRQFFWVPHRFRYGILAAGTWGNWGDIPTAVIMSITSAAPFNGQKDSDLAVAYVSIFILVFYITLFPLGGHLLIGKDFQGPDFTDDEVRESFPVKVRKTGHQLAQLPVSFISLVRGQRSSPPPPTTDVEKQLEAVDEKLAIEASKLANTRESVVIADTDTPVFSASPTVISEPTSPPSGVRLTRTVTFHPEAEDVAADLERTPYAATVVSAPTAVPDDAPTDTSPDKVPLSESGLGQPKPTRFQRVLSFLKTLNTPPTISIFIAFPVALIPTLKALFVQSNDSPTLHSISHSAPDGLPPLAFILDTASFIGAASVPLGLICLGSALARLNVPKPWTRLPLGAIGWFTVAKLFLMPIMGVAMCAFFTSTVRIINPEDKVLRFFSSVPTATSQVFLTQLYSPDGNAEHLSAFLVPQYALMFLSMTTLNAYALHLLYP